MAFMRVDADGGAPHNLVVALAPTAAEAWRDLAREFSIDFDGRGTALIDHAHVIPALDRDGAHTAIGVALNTTRAPTHADASVLAADTLRGPPIRYRGIAHALPAQFPLAHAVLSAPPTAYSYDAPESASALESATAVDADLDGAGGPYVAGSAAALVSAFQTFDGARAIWAGSVDLFSDAFAGAESGNEAFVRDVTQWAFQEKAVLRVDSVAHRRTSELAPREQYRVGDEMVRRTSWRID